MPPSELLASVHGLVVKLLDGLYLVDLREEGVVADDDLVDPNEDVI